MRFWKFNLFFSLIITPVLSIAERFTSKECLNSSFKTEIEHKGKFFGLVKNTLWLEKEKCLLHITFKDVLETKWIIDVCRDPIHIKREKNGNLEVLKRPKSGCKGPDSDYCESWTNLNTTLQDHGLIFAKGEREILVQSHGQVYCSFLLLEKYLGEGKTFSQHSDDIESIYPNENKLRNETCDLENKKISKESVREEMPVVAPVTTDQERKF